jgi:uncharacterized membrane protein (UPF0127 family)
MKAINTTKNVILADRLSAATGLFSRMKGLLGRSNLPNGEGLWIKPCKSIHTIGMKFPIDVIFLDSGLTVVATLADVRSGRLSPFYGSAASVIELPAGVIASSATQVGDTIALA